MSNEHVINLLRRVSELWNETEEFVKLAEQVNESEVVIPSVNELRYAGRRCIDLVQLYLNDNNPGSSDATEATNIAATIEQYALNAKHDCLDSMSTGVRGDIADLCDEYTTNIVMHHLDVVGIRNKIFEIDEFIRESRRNRQGREDTYDALLRQNSAILLDYKKLITKNLTSINDEWEEERIKRRKTTIFNWSGWVFGFLGLMIGAVCLFA